MRTPGTVSSADMKEYKPVLLKEGQSLFEATVIEEVDERGNPKTTYEIKEAAFSGETAVNGIRREDSSQVFPLDLAKTKEIHVINPGFESQRYKEGNRPIRFVLAKIVTDSGETIDQALLPEKLSFGGVNLKTGLRADWPEISSIKTIIIRKSGSHAAETINEVNQACKDIKPKTCKVVKKIR